MGVWGLPGAAPHESGLEPTLYACTGTVQGVPASRPGKSEEIRGGQGKEGNRGPKGHVGSAGQDRVGTGLPWGHQAGLALPCWGQQLEGSKYSAGRPSHIPGRPAWLACPLL